MLTKGKTSKFRVVKYAAMVLALVAVLALCLTACGKAAPVSAEYVAGTLTDSEYNRGETFDCTGAQIKVTYDNDTTETVNVTPAMVGEVVLNTVGATTVSVTYSTEGGTITATIPVTVLDPLAADREAAIAKINGNTLVAQNANDAGVKNLLIDYAQVINAAGTKTDIDTFVSGFETKLAAYLKAKTDAVSEVNKVDYTVLVEQFKLRADSALLKVTSDIKAAATVEAVEDLVKAYTAEITNIINEQKVYIENSGPITPDNVGPGMIGEKIELLAKTKRYIAHLETLRDDVAAYSTSVNKQVYLGEFKAALGDLEFWYEYIQLAIDLRGIEDIIDDIYVKNARTDLDDIYDALKDVLYNIDDKTYTEDVLGDGADITIVPGAYTVNESTKELICNTMTDKDAIWMLIQQMAEDYNDYAEKFGDELAQRNMKAYTIFNTDITIDLYAYSEQFMFVYMDLVSKQAEAAHIIDLIDAIADVDAEDTDKKNEAIANAWTALKEWGKENLIFSENGEITAYHNNLVFDKTYEGIFKVIETEDSSKYELGEYDFSEDYMVKYFVPNYDELIEATIGADIQKVKDFVADIPEYIIYATETEGVDSKSAIETARKARDDFYHHYGEAVYEEVALVNGVDEIDKTITAAEDEYDGLVEMANDINTNLIPALKDNVDEIVISDYRGTNGALKAAYDKYLEFAKRNDDADGKYYTGVITEQDHLIDCIDKYIELAYKEERSVLAPVKVYVYADTRLNNGTVGEDETALREAIALRADELVLELLEEKYNYDATRGLAEGETLNNYNRITVLEANMKYIIETFLPYAENEINTAEPKVDTPDDDIPGDDVPGDDIPGDDTPGDDVVGG